MGHRAFPLAAGVDEPRLTPESLRAAEPPERTPDDAPAAVAAPVATPIAQRKERARLYYALLIAAAVLVAAFWLISRLRA